MLFGDSYRLGKPQDCNHSGRRQGFVSIARDNKDKEAEPTREFAPQITHEEGISSYGQGCD